MLNWPVDPDAADTMLNPQAAADILAEITRTMCSIEALLEPVGIEKMRFKIETALTQHGSDQSFGNTIVIATGARAYAVNACVAADKRDKTIITILDAWEADLDRQHTRLSTRSMIIEELYVIQSPLHTFIVNILFSCFSVRFSFVLCTGTTNIISFQYYNLPSVSKLKLRQEIYYLI